MSLVVISSQNLSPGVRGALTKWLLEIGPGTFVGKISERIAQELWQAVDEWCESADPEVNAHATLVRVAQTEQGYVFATSGEGRYLPIEFAGLWLVERASATTGLTPKAHAKALDTSSDPANSDSDTAVPW